MNIHFVGVGGVGMAALACLLKRRGHEVSGCDKFASPRTAWLEGEGVRVSIGHDPRHVDGVDLVVLTPAVPLDEPERLAAKKTMSRGELLAKMMGEGDTIAVAGTHGKTTTATWTARLLLALGEHVRWCVGGETGDFPVAGEAGDTSREAVFVAEADESDGTLALYHVRTLVVNKTEYDHPDFFKTEESYFACFDQARAQAGAVVESDTLPPADDALERLLAALPPHNKKNARAAIEVALRRGHSVEAIAAALPPIIGALPDRRFQRVAGRVFTDYAHHPTEMACAIAMARREGAGVLRVLFQPHRYSRTKALLDAFPTALAAADEVVLCPTYAAFEKPVEGGDIADLYAACRRSFSAASPRCRLYLARSCEEAWEHARNSMTGEDVTLLLGAGDIVKLVPQVESDLSATDAPRPRRRIWIGQGSNTWKSDLNLSVEYVRTTHPAGRSGAEVVREHPGLCPWMAGIPGTVGGWIKMNAGAFGHSFSEVLEAVKIDGAWVAAADCGFGYRTSAITGEIQDFKLKKASCAGLPPTASSPSRPLSLSRPLPVHELPPHSSPPLPSPADYLARRKKFPAGTFGSFFKNPPGDFAGRLLEEAGCKDLRVGGAFVWHEHANVIVRGADATPSDVLALARLMRNRVLFRFGVSLTPEVTGIDLTA